MYGLYRSITQLASPFMPLWLARRRKAGKEDPERMQERFGIASVPRPKGKLLWIHAASVGESNAALPLIKLALDTNPALHVLLTTGTVTSANLMKKQLPERAIHQYVPIDTPSAVTSFMEHWRPQMALFVDSELWPNLIVKARQYAVLGMVNARMSEKSFSSWRYAKPLIARLLGSFKFCFAQSKEDGERLQELGIDTIDHIGNIKYDVPPLKFDTAELQRLKAQIGDRPIWLAASTHPGEEDMVADAHRELQEKFPNILTIIVPRHADRGTEIKESIEGLSIAQRSQGIPIFPETDIYLADTMGELGLFYSLARIALIGGSLVDNGGQNPIEALQLGCPIMLGPYMDNFAAITMGIQRAQACIRVQDESQVAGAVGKLLKDDSMHEKMAEAGIKHVKANEGHLAAIANKIKQGLAV